MQSSLSSQPRIGYAGRTSTKAPSWHWLVVIDVLLNNLTTGLFLVAAVAELAAPSTFKHTTSLAYPIALTLLTFDLICLVLDLGDPLRFHHMLRVFKPSSPMSLGTWCLTAYSFPLTIIVAIEAGQWLGLLATDSALLGWLRMLAIILGILPAFGSAAYKGVLFSTTAQPGWRDARWLGGYLLNSAAMLGSVLLLALAALLGETKATALLRSSTLVLVILNAIPLLLLAIELRKALPHLYSRQELYFASVLWLLLGFILPIMILAFGNHTLLDVAVASGLLFTSLVIRYGIVWMPHRAEHL